MPTIAVMIVASKMIRLVIMAADPFLAVVRLLSNIV
jgi:hypothetical protein